MNSTRLPNKAMKKIGDQTMLYHVIRQTLSSKFIKDVIIATTNSKKDDKIINFCLKNNFKYFRGSNHDVLDRYYKCAKKFSCSSIIRISSDCPFIDPDVIDKVIRKFVTKKYDYVANNLAYIDNKWQNSTCNFPQGMVIEISSFGALEKAWVNAKKPSEREHVFPYVQFNPKIFHVSNVRNQKNHSFLRCTVDKHEDLEFVREIWKRFPKSKKIIHMDDIIKIIDKEPKLLQINKNTDFDEGYKKSLQKDKKLKNRI